MIKDIREYHSSLKGINLVSGCKERSQKLCEKLKEGFPAPAPSARVEQGWIEGENGDIEPHFWVVIDGVDMEDTYSGDEIILDPSLRQFSKNNFENDKNDIWIEDSDKFDKIEVITPDDSLYDRYK